MMTEYYVARDSIFKYENYDLYLYFNSKWILMYNNDLIPGLRGITTEEAESLMMIQELSI